jgi:ubiquinone/menaquinone biosynthesis C-methylase UbiE
VEEGKAVLDIGCGSGTFTIALAKMVGEAGKFIAIDVQSEMLKWSGGKRLGWTRIPHNHSQERVIWNWHLRKKRL